MARKLIHPSHMVPLLSFACVHVKLLQSSPTLCKPTDCSPTDSSVHGILQARILEWVAVCSPGVLPNPGIENRSLALQPDFFFLPSEPPGKPLKVYLCQYIIQECSLTAYLGGCVHNMCLFQTQVVNRKHENCSGCGIVSAVLRFRTAYINVVPHKFTLPSMSHCSSLYTGIFPGICV